MFGKEKLSKKIFFKSSIVVFSLIIIAAAAWTVKFRPAPLSPAAEAVIPPYYDLAAFEHHLPALGGPAADEKNAPGRIKLPILMYHYVDQTPPAADLIRKNLTINPDIFEEQISSLKAAGYEFYFAGEIPDLIGGGIKPADKAVALTFDDGYEDFHTVVLPLLKKYGIKATVYLIDHAIGGQAYLNDAQIKEALDSGLVEIGSHTLDHTALKTKTPAEQRRQLLASKIELEKRFGVQVRTLAYPYGSFSDLTAELARGAGYGCALSVIPGSRQSRENLYYLSRLRPGSKTGRILLDFLEK